MATTTPKTSSGNQPAPSRQSSVESGPMIETAIDFLALHRIESDGSVTPEQVLMLFSKRWQTLSILGHRIHAALPAANTAAA
jgi:hypothetical protein